MAALANAYTASANFVGAKSVNLVADRVHVSQRWMVLVGSLLAAGAVEVPVGVTVPLLGVAARIGLVAYSVCALSAHIRAHGSGFRGAVSFLLIGVAALSLDLAYHSHG